MCTIIDSRHKKVYYKMCKYISALSSGNAKRDARRATANQNAETIIRVKHQVNCVLLNKLLLYEV